MGTPNKWLSSYLDNLTQQCFVNGSLSNTCTLLCGVSQGTILGPLLFLLCINDLPSCLSSSEPRMCADDIHLTCAGNEIYSIQSSLNRDLLNISHWLTANKLTLDMTKTEFMSIGTRQKLNNLPSPTAIEINVTRINQVYSTKSLSIIIDGNLTWVNHIDILSKKKLLPVLELSNGSCTHYVPPATLHGISIGVSFNRTLIIVILSGIVVAKPFLHKLQRLQNLAARVPTPSSHMMPTPMSL